MSISIGIYDFFSYTVPGLIYLLVIYRASDLFHLIKVDISQLSISVQWGGAIFLVVLAFLIGHIFDTISHLVWYRVFYRGRSPERAYEKFTKMKKGIKASFDPEQWEILLGAIRHNSAGVADGIDRNKATSIMLRNISFALFLLGVIIFAQALMSVVISYALVVLSVIVFIVSGVSLRRSDHFNMGFYHTIYVQSLMYGDSVSSVLEANRKDFSGSGGGKIRSPKLARTSKKKS